MKAKIYIFIAAAIIFLVFLSYFYQFYIVLKYELAKDTAMWAQFGDYVGGLLNPLLSFVSIVLLIKSLSLQNQANRDLRQELKNTEKTEKLRSFETLFFNLINTQKILFDEFKIHVDVESEQASFHRTLAVLRIEDDIEEIKDSGGSNKEVKEYLETLDVNDEIFGLCRAFYILTLIITEKLSDNQGFSKQDRKTHFITLVNLTDFSQLRLIVLCAQFLDYHSCSYVRSSAELRDVFDELCLPLDGY